MESLVIITIINIPLLLRRAGRGGWWIGGGSTAARASASFTEPSSERFMVTETITAASSIRSHISGFGGGRCAALSSLLSPQCQPPLPLLVVFLSSRRLPHLIDNDSHISK